MYAVSFSVVTIELRTYKHLHTYTTHQTLATLITNKNRKFSSNRTELP